MKIIRYKPRLKTRKDERAQRQEWRAKHAINDRVMDNTFHRCKARDTTGRCSLPAYHEGGHDFIKSRGQRP